MEKNNMEEMTLLDHIEKLSDLHKDTGALQGNDFDRFVKKAKPHIAFICGRLNITEIQATFLSDIISLFEGNEVGLSSLAEFIGCRTIKIFRYIEELNMLERKNFIKIRKSDFRDSVFFEVDFDTIETLQKGLAPTSNAGKKLAIDDFFTEVAKLCENRVQRHVDFRNTLRGMNRLLDNNRHLDFVKKLKSYNLSADDEMILLRFCHYLIDLDQDEMNLDYLSRLYNNQSEFRNAKQQLKSGTNALQTLGLLKNVNDDGLGNADTFCLTEKARDELLFDFEQEFSSRAVRGIKNPAEIAVKLLFYPEKTARQITELTSLLREENFGSVQKRLSEQGMRTGFACLFSGVPGTGKTETALQIARETGRGIMQVDIADTKSMWFGESEKKIKQVFSRYRAAVKHSPVVPVLLFNEADAIIGKRRNLGENREGPGQTENAIQNIILQEIENLNGILIATTNLTQNMDKAFERRFLYKIEFEKPTPETRKSIWQALIPELLPRETDALAARFDFSGGQIENIARRGTVSAVMHGEPPSLDTLIGFCRDEISGAAPATPIGFAGSL